MHVAFQDDDGSLPTSSAPATADLATAVEAPAVATLLAAEGQKYAELVARLVDKVGGERREAIQWLKGTSPGKTVCDHVAVVLGTGVITDTASRKKLVEAAVRRRQQQMQECAPGIGMSPRSTRHINRRLVSTVTAATTIGERLTSRRAAERKEVPAPPLSATPSSAEAGLPSDGRTWVRVEGFTTREEAVSFVRICQPFEYRPVQGEVSLESEDDAASPEPIEFLSAGGDFTRRLRIRKLDPIELRPQSCEAAAAAIAGTRWRTPTPATPGSGSSGGLRRGPRHPTSALTQTPPPQAAKELKPWAVEASGALFERPESLRALRTVRGPAPQRYFVAVAADVERRVLTEGFRVKRQFSIPCAATKKDAIVAWQSKQRDGRAVTARPSVLTVTLPPDIDVISNRDGAFRIKARELPAVCFSRCRRPGSGPEML